MSSQEVPDPDVTPPPTPPGAEAWRKVVQPVMAGFTADEVTEIRRGLLHRMTVAQANRNDTSIAPDQRARWEAMYITDWAAFNKVTQATSPVGPNPIKHTQSESKGG